MAYLLALGLILRLIFINQSLWLDESIEALALQGRFGPLLHYALADYQPPLYHLIGYLNTHLFGFSELALRLPSLICGVLTIYFVVQLATLFAGKKIGFIAGLLAATNPLLIYYSQEGRTYAMTAFFVTASFYYFFKMLDTQSWSLKSRILYFIFTTCFIYTSYLSWFALLAQGIYALYCKRKDLLMIQVFSALTLLAWMPSFLSSLAIGRSTMGTSPEWGRVVGGLSWKSLPLTWVKFGIGRISFDYKPLYAFIVFLLGAFHLGILRKLDLKKYSLLLIWLLPPLLFGFLVSTVLPVYSYFRLLFVLPAYLIVLALASPKLSKILVVLNIVFLSIFWLTPKYHREDWRALSRDLTLAGATAIAMPSRDQSAGLLYYGVDSVSIFEPKSESLRGDKIYYVRYVEDLFDPLQYGKAKMLDSGYTITSQKFYPGIQMDIYENSN